jgi:RNA polymerase I-specific transcription initiation factor RRN3
MNEADLDSFFPFDPFKLPLSARFIDGIYRNWEALPGDEDSESDEDDEEEEEEEEEQEADEGDESMDTFPGPTSYEDSGFHIPGTAAGGRRRGKGKNRRGSGGLTVSSSQEDSEVDMLGRSLDQAMSISPAMGLVGRMGVAAPGGGGEKSVRWN